MKQSPKLARKKTRLQIQASDAGWLAVAARLAARARARSRPNPAVGAVLVKNGIIVGTGWTNPGGRPHAEAVALAQAGVHAKGATLYTTLEPCSHRSKRGPSCTDLIIDAQPEAVVFAVKDPDIRTFGDGAKRIANAGIKVRQLECSSSTASLAGYLTHKREGRPFVTLKLAISLDGSIALANGESRWITGEASRAHVHSQRAQSDGILVGGATWRTDRPRLDVRLAGLETRSPERFVLTRGAPPDGAKAIAAPGAIKSMDDIHYLYVEGGAHTAAAFVAADLVDMIHLYRAPILIGGGQPCIADIGLSDLGGAQNRWMLADQRKFGNDQFEAYERRPREKDTCSPE